MSDIERKRSNVSSNNSIEKSSECSLINDDEIENKKSKKSPERNILIECLTKPDESTRRVITSKFAIIISEFLKKKTFHFFQENNNRIHHLLHYYHFLLIPSMKNLLVKFIVLFHPGIIV
jgi:hypothetical protein